MNPEDLNHLMLQWFPAGAYRWGAECLLSRTANETGKVKIDFQRPVFLCGAFCEVTQATAVGGLIVPTVADLNVSIEVDRGVRYTSSDTEVPNVNPWAQYVPVRACTINGLSVMRLRLDYGSPVVSVQFRWRRLPAGGPWYEDAQVNLTFSGDYLQP